MTAPRISPAIVGSAPFASVYRDFSATVVRESAVDPVLTEVVRLRCAQYHDCRLCGSLRVVEARESGLDERLVAAISFHESSDLPEQWKAALRLTDAMIIAPGSISPAVREDVRRHLDDEQIAELLFDILKWSYQKTLVALRVEPPADDDRLSDLVWEADGHPTIVPRDAEQSAGTAGAASIGIV